MSWVFRLCEGVECERDSEERYSEGLYWCGGFIEATKGEREPPNREDASLRERRLSLVRWKRLSGDFQALIRWAKAEKDGEFIKRERESVCVCVLERARERRLFY